MLWYCLQRGAKGSHRLAQGRQQKGAESPRVTSSPSGREPCEDMLSTERQRARPGKLDGQQPGSEWRATWSRERRCRRTEETKMGRS